MTGYVTADEIDRIFRENLTEVLEEPEFHAEYGHLRIRPGALQRPDHSCAGSAHWIAAEELGRCDL